jgi:hypothetical protein
MSQWLGTEQALYKSMEVGNARPPTAALAARRLRANGQKVGEEAGDRRVVFRLPAPD